MESAHDVTSSLRGTGSAYGHHGEILQGVFAIEDRSVPGLLSLPCRDLWSDVSLELSVGRAVVVFPAWKVKVRSAIELTLAALGRADLGACATVESNIDPSRGYGSSTSDVTAAIRAVMSALGHDGSPEEVARIAVAAEGASDNTLFPRPLLFAQRDAIVIEDYGVIELPAMVVVGFETTPGGSGVETLSLRMPAYTPWELRAFGVLRALLRRAILRSDARELGAVASASAQLNQRHYPVGRFGAFIELGRQLGAAGFQVAHSGDVAGLMFDPAAPAAERSLARAGETLSDWGLRPWRFAVGQAA